jgi:hypothetical protein
LEHRLLHGTVHKRSRPTPLRPIQGPRGIAYVVARDSHVPIAVEGELRADIFATGADGFDSSKCRRKRIEVQTGILVESFNGLASLRSPDAIYASWIAADAVKLALQGTGQFGNADFVGQRWRC